MSMNSAMVIFFFTVLEAFLQVLYELVKSVRGLLCGGVDPDCLGFPLVPLRTVEAFSTLVDAF